MKGRGPAPTHGVPANAPRPGARNCGVMALPPITAMTSEQTTALICFSNRDLQSGSHVQLCLGTEGGGADEAPYAFTITIANIAGAAPSSRGSSNITERIPLTHADIEKLRGWIELVAPPR